jgi:anti-sigma regulatory factor (Ser/Thr protein kinase)
LSCWVLHDTEHQPKFISSNIRNNRRQYVRNSPSDDGVPFNPFTHSDPDTSLSIDEREIGGLGVMLVKQLTNSQTYQRLSDRNIVTLTIELEHKK